MARLRAIPSQGGTEDREVLQIKNMDEYNGRFSEAHVLSLEEDKVCMVISWSSNYD